MLLIGSLFWRSSEERDVSLTSEGSNRMLFGDVPSEKIARVIIADGSGKSELLLVDNQWVLPARSNYRADNTKVQAFVLNLLSLSVSKVVSNSTKDYEKLGVGERLDGSGIGKVLFFDVENSVLGGLHVGSLRERANSSPQKPKIFDGQYLRRVGENAVYLLDEAISINSSNLFWLDLSLANVLTSRIESVEQARLKSDGEVLVEFELIRNAAFQGASDTSFVPGGTVVEGARVRPLTISQVVSGLENLRLNDVARRTNAVGNGALPVEFDMKTTYRLLNGLSYAVSTHESKESEKYYAAIEVKFDMERASRLVEREEQAKQEEASSIGSGDDSNSKKIERELKMSNVEEAKVLNEAYAPWIYELPDYLAQKFRSSKEDLFERAESQKPVF